MNRLVPIQSWLPQDVAEQIKRHCRNNCLPVSEFIRALVVEACAMGLEANRFESHLEWISSNLNFTAVALDALLQGHDDPDLRGRVDRAFAVKEERRSAALVGKGGAVR